MDKTLWLTFFLGHPVYTVMLARTEVTIRASVNTTTPRIDRKHMHCKNNSRNTDTIYTVKIINTRPMNFLTKIQNVIINGK